MTGRISIVGSGHTKFGRLEQNLEEMIVEVTREAVEESGVDPADIDAVFLGHFNSGMVEDGFASSLILQAYPELRFKLDPVSDWDDELIAELVASGAVNSLDLKGQYKGTVVDLETDPDLYARLVAAFPNAWLEDPDIDEETAEILAPHRDRVTWDAPIHSIADIAEQPFLAPEYRRTPRMVNIKPSRMGGVKGLFDAYDFCEAQEIQMYGGGQWELGVGRLQIQHLAALFHPDTPNDTAPVGYNDPAIPADLPVSPLALHTDQQGFR